MNLVHVSLILARITEDAFHKGIRHIALVCRDGLESSVKHPLNYAHLPTTPVSLMAFVTTMEGSMAASVLQAGQVEAVN